MMRFEPVCRRQIGGVAFAFAFVLSIAWRCLHGVLHLLMAQEETRELTVATGKDEGEGLGR